MFTFCKAKWARQKKNHATKVTKIPNTKRRKCGMNKTLINWPKGIDQIKQGTLEANRLSSDFYQNVSFWNKPKSKRPDILWKDTVLKSVNSNFTLAVLSQKFGQAKTHFLSLDNVCYINRFANFLTRGQWSNGKHDRLLIYWS